MQLDIAIEDARWQTVAFEEISNRVSDLALAHLGIDGGAVELSVLACDDATIAQLNADYRQKDSATNVLSWPAAERGADFPGGPPVPPMAGPDGVVGLGDMAISYETCAKEAEEAGKPLADHITHLLVHGLLHLLGYDHETDADAALMEGIEAEILAKLGLPNPYLDY